VIELARKLLERAREAGATYADVRVIRQKEQGVTVKDGVVASVTNQEDAGLGVRVIAQGAWGFASAPGLDLERALQVAEEAVAIARASAMFKTGEDVCLAPADIVEDTYSTPYRTDPFDVPLQDKVDLLLKADREMRSVGRVRSTTAQLRFRKEEKLFASTEGTIIHQTLLESGGNISATAAELMEAQTRSWGNWGTGGYEIVQDLDLEGQAPRVAKEAAALLDAEQCPSGETTVILDGPMMALQIHESCGHPVELDRVLGTEVSLAGTSFLTLDKRSHFRYGSEHVNLVADATIPGGLGTFGYDDEGVPAQRTELVSQGIFQGYLTSRETARVLGERSNGAMRATGWNKIPLIRMTNINLEPGDWTLEEMIRDTKEGLYFCGVSSGSIDDLRINFQFGAQLGYRIEDGSLGSLIKNPTYTGKTPAFWGACDAIAGRAPGEWRVWGIPNCGKGEPMQVAHVGHGTAPTRIRRLRVGVSRW